MPIHISVDRVVEMAADRMPAVKEAQTEQQKAHIIPITKYNLLTMAFNASTVLLTIAVASAVFFAYTTAFVFGAAAIFIRYTSARELHKYTLPAEPLPQRQAAELWQGVRAAFRNPVAYISAQLEHALNTASQEDKEANIFHRLGLVKPEEWSKDEIFIFDHPVWKNRIPAECPRIQQEAHEDVVFGIPQDRHVPEQEGEE